MNQPAHHFQLALKACLKEEGLSARAFAQRVGVNNSLISRLDEHRVDSDSLAKMVRHYAGQPQRVIDLLRAHLWDEVIRAGVDPDVVWSSLVDGDIAWLAKLSPGVQADLEVIGGEAMTNSGIRLSITGIAESILRGRAAQGDCGPKFYPMSDPPASLAAEDPPAPRFARCQKVDPVRAAVAAEKARRAARAPLAAPRSSPSAPAKAD